MGERIYTGAHLCNGISAVDNIGSTYWCKIKVDVSHLKYFNLLIKVSRKSGLLSTMFHIHKTCFSLCECQFQHFKSQNMGILNANTISNENTPFWHFKMPKVFYEIDTCKLAFKHQNLAFKHTPKLL